MKYRTNKAAAEDTIDAARGALQAAGARRVADMVVPIFSALQDGEGEQTAAVLLEEAAEEIQDTRPELAEEIRSLAERARSSAAESDDADDDEPEPAENRRPQSHEYASRAEFRAALRRWNRKRASREGPAIRRGRTPSIVTRTPDES